MESGQGDGSADVGARRIAPWGLNYTDRRPRTGLLLLRKRLARPMHARSGQITSAGLKGMD